MQTKPNTSALFNDFKQKILNLRTNQTFLICSLLSIIYLISGYCKWIEILVSLTALTFMAIIPLQSALCVFTFLHSFTLSQIGYDSCFMVTIIGFCIILLVKYIIGLNKGKYELKKQTIQSLMWFVLISLIISSFYDLYRGAWLYLIYIPLFYLIFIMRKEFDIKQAINYMFGGLVCSCTLAVVTLLFPHYNYYILMGGRFNAFTNNTNYLSMRALFVLTYYMYSYLNGELHHSKFIIIYIFK